MLFAPWILLAISLVFLSFKNIISFIFLIGAIIIAWIQGILTPLSITFLCIIFGITLVHQYYKTKTTLFIITEIILAGFGVLLFLHDIPGFNNPKILDKILVGPHSAPYSMYFNFDKALLVFVLLGALPTLFYVPSSSNHTWKSWLILIFCMPVLLLIATALGGLKIEPHLPPWLWQFALANLFFVSLAEEALFRGYIQRRLSGWLGKSLGLWISAILFGLAHYTGGALLIIFATLAGFIYGMAWMWSGRLWVSTLFHFSFNLIHLLFFTYPIYKG
ncbi:CPBP family intramembrane glutamic endopeptidase [Helicobacter sp. 11S03491-1]|uniref:CPBP family intramembrane glutamic endopeptidase n=1 Tax=Helicobacter sp. 11S03491-1 TaxID=1476196 RepID=UPI000BA5133A|nr:CPBP family intramembrane glutamic endopeptidase [Helicobacter sp. 11S03491-1]PAF42610.1 CAAX protease family protein [Helicobacter sp. 11S03491-1]